MELNRTTLLVLAALLAPVAATAAAAPWETRKIARVAVQDDGDETPAERKKRLDEEASEVAEALREGLRSNERDERLASLAEASETVHPRVIEVMADTLGDKDEFVARRAALHLGQMRHPESSKALQKYARRNARAIQADPEFEETVVRAIGLQEDPAALRWLADRATDAEAYDVRRMRVFAMARPRTRASFDAVFELMRRTDQDRLRGRMREFRTALIWMTGEDLGDRAEDWFAWERALGKDYELPKDAPVMVAEREREWYYAWGEEPPARRQKKRGDRG